jgi:hypothetical protein
MNHKKVENTRAEWYKSVKINHFLKYGYVYIMKAPENFMDEIFLKNIPSDVLCITMITYIRDYIFVLDVSKVKSISEDGNHLFIKMEHSTDDTAIYTSKVYFDYKNMMNILKRLKRFDILLQIEG